MSYISSSSDMREEERTFGSLAIGNMPPPPIPNARSQVLASEDILPTIFLHLQDLLVRKNEDETAKPESSTPEGDEQGQETQGGGSPADWKSRCASLVLVNRAFFHAGASVLWGTMNELTPIFKLLPWFKEDYKGVGATNTSSGEAWTRFNLYAAFVKKLELQYASTISLATPWYIQLLTLPGRPDPLFPNLHLITFSPAATSGLYLLFLLTGPSLRNLEVITCSEMDVFGNIPGDWKYISADLEAQDAPVLRDLLAASPRIAFSASQLNSLKYCGPFSDELLHHVSTMKALTNLHLVLASKQDVRQLAALRELALLEQLRVVVPSLLEGNDVDLAEDRSEESFSRLRTLAVDAMEHSQWLIWRCLQPRKLHSLYLCIGGTAETLPYYTCLGSYLRLNPSLDTLRVNFVRRDSTDQIQNMAQWPSTTLAEDAARNAFASCTNLVGVSFTNIPSSLCDGTAALLQRSIIHWKKLTGLVLCPDDLGSTAEGEPKKDDGLPGLSFFLDIVKGCPALETLEFCFGMDCIARDSGGRAIQQLLGKFDEDFSGSASDHPLRTLVLDTAVPADGASISMERKEIIDLALYLNRLFPQLEVVDGSASQTRNDVAQLITAYQTVLEHALTRIVSRTRNA